MEVTFTPHLLPINRGILSTIYCETKNNLSLKSIHQIYDEFYKNEMYGIYAKCIFPIMNKFFYKDIVFKILCD